MTVDDVVFSIERARSATSDIKGGLENIVAVEAIDDQIVWITTSKPGESVWHLLTFVSIMSKAWAEKHGVTVPENRLAGETSYATRHANGTGPFVLKEFEPNGRVVMVRNPDWWGLKDYPHNIDRIEHAMIAAPEGRLAALLSGEVDFLMDPPWLASNRSRMPKTSKSRRQRSSAPFGWAWTRAAPNSGRPT